ncbi:MAG: hypothetical protein H6673_08630 [Anaerolineales bacterium]|nr:hypothetical protein [Anaerolineales bacterium]
MFNPNDYGLEVEDLPTWMRPRYRGIDWTVVATLILCIVACWPILNAPIYSIPRSLQAETELYRIVEIASVMESGQVYPRWAANFNYGYGSPIFNYVAPLPYYLGGTYLILTQDAPPIGLKAIALLGVFCLGLATTAFARRRWGDTVGVMATALVLFSPTLASTVHLYTDLGVLWAGAFFMGSLWSLERLVAHGRGRDMALSAFMTMGLLLSHYSVAPIYLAIITGWVITCRSQHFRWVVMSLLLGIGGASLFLVPAVIDANAVTWEPLSVYPTAVKTSQLFEASPRLDLALFNPPPIMRLGVAQWLLGIAGAGWLLWKRKKADSYFLGWGLLFILLLHFSEMWAYQNTFGAFRSTDIMLPLTLCAALVASQTVNLIEEQVSTTRRRWLSMTIIIFMVTLSGASTIIMPSYLPTSRSDVTTQHLNSELRGYMLGSITNGHLLPQGVEVLPDVSRSVVGNLEQIDKIDRLSLPRNTRVTILEHSPSNDSFIIENRSTEHEITILTFNYPGWKATRNQERIDLRTQSPNGFIGLAIEPEINDIHLYFSETPIRQLAWSISGISLLIMAALVIWRERRATPLPPNTLTPLAYKRQRERYRLIAFMTIVLAITYGAIHFRPALVTTQTPNTSIPNEAVPMERIVEGGLDFLGFDLEQTQVNAGNSVFLNTYWASSVPNLPNYQLELSVLHNGAVVQSQTYRHLANWPSREWPLDGYTIATYRIPMPTVPGDYTISLQVGTCERLDLRPCEVLEPRDVYDLHGPATQQIILPQTIRVE